MASSLPDLVLVTRYPSSSFTDYGGAYGVIEVDALVRPPPTATTAKGRIEVLRLRHQTVHTLGILRPVGKMI